ncbi:MAG: peptidylprolyl isomerase [Crocinitomicaceae bacterium]|nr:peptidylprolyl isomerase [Crocinitomicaceae bacterium]|tara:strand:+ start:1546 stop:1971 length:426 start_codon:yes stop_codon:yes gene_type:complete
MKVEQNKNVSVHYTGKLKDGSVFDSSVDREPLNFTVGEGKLIPGFEQGIVGMGVNEKKLIEIPFIEAYGEVKEELIQEVSKSNLPSDLTPEVGMQLQSNGQDGSTILVTIVKVEEDKIVVDANHPLAGKDLLFDIEVVEIK